MELISAEVLRNREQLEAVTEEPKYPRRYETPPGFDLSDILAFRTGQPHEYFHTLRAQAPIAWSNVPDYAGYWSLTRYDDVRYCDQNPKLFSSQKGGILMAIGDPKEGPPRLMHATLNSLINMDQPYHLPLRMEQRPFFSTDFAQKLRARVTTEVDRLLDNMERLAHKQDGRVDLVKHFSSWLPLFTLCEILGIEERDRPAIVRWVHYLELASYIVSDPESKISKLFALKFLWNLRQMFRFGERMLAARRKKPRDDLLTVIAQSKLGNEPMSQPFLDGSWLLIVFAGNDTTRNSLSGTMRLLTQFPEQRQMLLDDPKLMPKMVPEALRLVSPVMYMRRTATEDTEIRGQKVAKDEKVIMWYGAANRDPEVFENPDAMDIHRANADQHLAFGIGPHICLGKRVAQMQLEVAYERMLDRFPHVRWTGEQSISPNNFVHGVTELIVQLNGGARA